MTKKELTYRPMFGFDASKPIKRIPPVYHVPDFGSLPGPPKREPSKDEVIADLRAKLAVYEAREAKRRESARKGMKKKRANKALASGK